METIVLPTGTANLRSVTVALERAGASPRLWSGEDLDDAERVVVPGVGAFDAGARALDENGWRAALARRAERGAPTLGVCLGMQLFARASDEGEGEGIGAIPLRVEALPDELPRPHFGWNRVEGEGLSGYAYFANSYALRAAPPGWRASWTRHGVDFVSALRRGGVALYQFHPELSGAFGASLIRAWLAGEEGACRAA